MKILLGVTSGIAIYKSCELVRLFVKAGHEVKVCMTPAACEFVRPYLFERLSGNKVFVETFAVTDACDVEHIALADWAEVALIAPATMSTIGKLANGIADNLLTTVFAALPQSTMLFIAPAMNEHMWCNPANVRNVEFLRGWKNVRFIGPAQGSLACGTDGVGRMSEPSEIFTVVVS
jgi:phosphopantothenoylcysteine decarboxylase/phosphopantothenate--cysteine ligase